MPTAAERFERLTMYAGDCIVWTGTTNPHGYGMFWFEGRLIGAHRFAYQSTHGDTPKDLVIDHLCRNTR